MRTIDEWIQHVRFLAISVMKLTDRIPFSTLNNEVIKQITRSPNSVAANYRATKRAKSSADFLNKYRIVEEEADERIHFIEIIRVRRRDLEKECIELIKEYEAFLSVVVASIQTISKNNSQLK